MAPDFDSIAFEIYNGTWVNVTADVSADPHPHWNRGIMSNKPADRVGDPGVLTFTLKNDASCLGGYAGYYSPGHTPHWSGWTSGLKVRLSFVFEGTTYYKFYGRIKPDGIDVEPGIYGARTVAVTCGDFMWMAAQHELKTLTFAVDQKIGDVVTAVNANMPIPPLATSIATGIETFPTIFDMAYIRTTAIAEYVKAAMSEWAHIYAIGDGASGETLIVENQDTRRLAGVTNIPLANAECGFALDEDDGFILDEDDGFVLLDDVQAASFDNLMIEGIVVDYGHTMANRVNSSVYPRRVDAAATTVLWSLQKSFEIKAFETITDYRCAYRDPENLATRISGIDMQTPVSGTDFTATLNEDGSGGPEVGHLTVTPNYGTEAVIYTFVNDAAHSIWVQTLKAIGKGVYTYESIQNSADSAASQAVHGVIPLSLDFKYLADTRKAQLLASYVLNLEKWPTVSIGACPIWANRNSMRMEGFLNLEPGTQATFKETQSGVNGDYFIQGYSAEIVEGKLVLWTPVLKYDPGYYMVYTGVVGIDTFISGAISQQTINYGTEALLPIGSAGTWSRRILIKFDFSTIPANAIVFSAVLTLITYYGGVSELDLSVYRCRRAWTELGATWITYDGANNWGTAGADNITTDRESAAIGTKTIGATGYTVSGVEITLDPALIQEMLTGGAFTNNGFVLRDDTEPESGNTHTYASFEYNVDSYRPKLVISYIVP